MAAGDVVNTAARLQASAPVNGILVGDATRRATREVIDYRDATPVDAKGKSEPVPAWTAVEARSPFGVDVRQHGAAPLVGRQRELELLVAAFERAVAERSPQLVTLVGVPGIGKSRLLWELFQQLDQRPELIRWRQGRSLSYGGAPFWAVAEMVKSHAGILEDDEPETTAAKLGEAVAAAVPEDEREWIESHLRTLIGLGMEQPRDRAEAFTAWRRLFESIAEQEPLVLVFEDLHWADDALLDFVDHLVDWGAGAPILVLCSARPELLERRSGWGGGKLNALVLALSPLGDAETATLLAAALGRSVLPVETQSALLERAGGNPLYAEQFARLYSESGGTDVLPESIHGIVSARLDALSRQEKALLQDAAVHGKVFWVGAVAAMAKRDIEALLHALERKEFVRRERRAAVGGDAEFAFRHILVRDVAYGQIPRAERGAKHEAAARWVESLGRPEDHAELVAHHYATALDLARAAGRETAELRERARRALREAGDRALALSAFGPAADHYRSALELWPQDDAERPLVLFGLGRALSLQGRSGQNELREAADALAAGGRHELAAEAEFLIGDLAWYAGNRAIADEQLARALALVEPLPPSRSKAWILAQASRMAMLAARHDEALDFGERALELAKSLDLADVRVNALTTVGGVRAWRHDASGLAELEESAALGERLNSPELPRTLNNLSGMYGTYGRVKESDETMRAAIAAGERFGLHQMALYSRGNLLYHLYREGEWHEALAGAEEVIGEAVAAGLHSVEKIALVARTLVQLGQGNVARAEADSARMLEIGRLQDDPQALLPALGSRIIVLAETGRVEEARPLAEELRTIGAAARLPFPGGTEIVHVARCVGVEDWLAMVGGAWRTPWLEAIEPLLKGDPDRAVELYTALEAPKDVAFARLEAAKMHLAAGRRAEAETHLERALVFYRRAGANRFIAEAEALLGTTARVEARRSP
jgi:tetratricopeptide (TPR) repeat protein